MKVHTIDWTASSKKKLKNNDSSQTKTFKANKKKIKNWVQSFGRALTQHRSLKKWQKQLLARKPELSIILVSLTQIKKINYKYRKKNKPTDVLSFSPYADSELKKSFTRALKSKQPLVLGELVLCPEVVAKNAKELNTTNDLELKLMLLHGLLHLLGFDHETSPQDEKKMLRIQKQVFNNS